MKAFFKLFDKELDTFLDPTVYIDCQNSPSRLLCELKQPNEMKRLIKFIQSPCSNPFQSIRILSLCHLLVIYSDKYFSLVEQKLKLTLTDDPWLNSQFLQPYRRFLVKCCTSVDQYSDIKRCHLRQGGALQGLFYSINMLKLLFKVVQKMPHLGRYYKPSQEPVISTAVEVIALQAQKLYGYFKATLTEILFRREHYIKNKDDQNIMKGVLADELGSINEEIKKLFLDKYFFPLGKGIGLKLFKPEEQTPQCQKYIHSILSDHADTERKKKQLQLEKILFPGSGLVDWNFYEETLLAGPLNVSGSLEEPIHKDLDEIVVSDQEVEGVGKIGKYEKRLVLSKTGQSQKQTSSGTIKLEGIQL